MSKIKDLNADFEAKKKIAKAKIKSEPNRLKRFFKWVLYLIVFPFKWLWYNIRDWRTALIFGIVCLVVSSEVWVPYLLAVITWGTNFSKIMLGVGSTCWIFWLGPGTPFMIICIGLTIGIKELFNRIKTRRNKNGSRETKELGSSEHRTEN